MTETTMRDASQCPGDGLYAIRVRTCCVNVFVGVDVTRDGMRRVGVVSWVVSTVVFNTVHTIFIVIVSEVDDATFRAGDREEGEAATVLFVPCLIVVARAVNKIRTRMLIVLRSPHENSPERTEMSPAVFVLFGVYGVPVTDASEEVIFGGAARRELEPDIDGHVGAT